MLFTRAWAVQDGSPDQSPLGLFSPLARLQLRPASRVASAHASPASIFTCLTGSVGSGASREFSRRSAADVEAACPECLSVAPGEPPDLALCLALGSPRPPWEALSSWGISGGGGLLPGRGLVGAVPGVVHVCRGARNTPTILHPDILVSGHTSWFRHSTSRTRCPGHILCNEPTCRTWTVPFAHVPPV